ncbi:MAG: hypothetical protein AAF713_01860 [Pseudomonadota bacterium]
MKMQKIAGQLCPDPFSHKQPRLLQSPKTNFGSAMEANGWLFAALCLMQVTWIAALPWMATAIYRAVAG